ncbi:MAG: hypothetical protein KF820_07550 [Candidatus Paracaedibacteraceae bacterium]|nr:hypothetical protein [Candidatus Paracaedibacteraceae bacterium]
MNFSKILVLSLFSFGVIAEETSVKDSNKLTQLGSVSETDGQTLILAPLMPTDIFDQHRRTLSQQDIIFLQGTFVTMALIGTMAVTIETGKGGDVFLFIATVAVYQLMNLLDLRAFNPSWVHDMSLVTGTVATGVGKLYSNIAAYPFVILFALALQRGYDWSGSRFFSELTDRGYTGIASFYRGLIAEEKKD